MGVSGLCAGRECTPPPVAAPPLKAGDRSSLLRLRREGQRKAGGLAGVGRPRRQEQFRRAADQRPVAKRVRASARGSAL